MLREILKSKQVIEANIKSSTELKERERLMTSLDLQKQAECLMF